MKYFATMSPGKMTGLAACAGLAGLIVPHALSLFFAGSGLLSGPRLLFLGMTETYVFLAGIALVFAVAAGSDSVRRIAGYGIGTGVPSVSMFTIGIGAVCGFFGIALSRSFAAGSLSAVLMPDDSYGQILYNLPAGPVIGVILSAVLGFIGGYAVNRIVGMNIPDMERRMAEVSFFCCLAFLLSSMIISGSCYVNQFLSAEIVGGFSALAFTGCAFVTFRAYNSNLGADEKPDRTRALALTDAAGFMIILSLISAGICYLSYSAYLSLSPFIMTGPVLSLLTGIALMILSFRAFCGYVRRDAYAVVNTGLLPTEEELQ
ncbi:MAG: tetrahydromethanopterin S-methyltransferase subunit C [Methanosarcinaceae archaeon]|nr:tetrahydromethanopterin S-methyltransferase subunit C [Methanosarcinaceae archaeon]